MQKGTVIMDISNRKKLILSAIVRLHEDKGDPVGSAILATFLRDLSVSSATLRNEMAELTNLGYLMQPHTSAGRVPTMLGFRYYIDNLINSYSLEHGEAAEIRSSVMSFDNDPDKAAESCSKRMAKYFGLAAVTTTPYRSVASVVHYKLISVGRFNVAILAITDSGSVKTRVTRVEAEPTIEQLVKAENALNKHLAFVSFEDITSEKLEAVLNFPETEREIMRGILRAAMILSQTITEKTLYYDGLQYLTRFRELDCEMKELLELFSDSTTLSKRMQRNDGVSVFVGEELSAYSLNNVSLISSGYTGRSGGKGSLGIAGPTRMNYAYIIPRLRVFCDAMSELLINR